MMFTPAQYDAAIANLTAAKKQLEPDGLPCSVCSDSGHAAWHCGHNPLVAVRLCLSIAEHSENLHTKLHYLAGHNQPFGMLIGPKRIILDDE